MQRLHEHDLVGHVLEKGGDWTVLNLPAIAEFEERIQLGPDRFKIRRVGELLHVDREPQGALDEIRANLGSDIFAAQYQQSPVPPGGLVIRRAWIQRYDDPPAKAPDCQIVQSWDTAVEAGAANDWSVGTTWLFREGEYYLLEVIRKRLEYPDLRREVDAAITRWRPNVVLIEKAGVGAALLQERQASRVAMVGIVPSGDKETRLRVQAAKFEGGPSVPAEAGELALRLRGGAVRLPRRAPRRPGGRHLAVPPVDQHPRATAPHPAALTAVLQRPCRRPNSDRSSYRSGRAGCRISRPSCLRFPTGATTIRSIRSRSSWNGPQDRGLRRL